MTITSLPIAILIKRESTEPLRALESVRVDEDSFELDAIMEDAPAKLSRKRHRDGDEAEVIRPAKRSVYDADILNRLHQATKKLSLEPDSSDGNSRKKRFSSSAEQEEENRDSLNGKKKTIYTRMRQCKTPEDCLKVLKRLKTPLMIALALIDAKKEHRVELLNSFDTSIILDISVSFMKYLIEKNHYDPKLLFLDLCNSHLEAKTKPGLFQSDYTDQLKNEYEFDLERFRKSNKRLRDFEMSSASSKKRKLLQ